MKLTQAALIVLAGTDTHEGMARLVNALEAAKEFKDAGDDVTLIFDGAGTKWIGQLTRADHQIHGLYAAVSDRIGGVCSFCAVAFGAKEEVEASGVSLLDQYDHHPSFKTLLDEGYQIITF